VFEEFVRNKLEQKKKIVRALERRYHYESLLPKINNDIKNAWILITKLEKENLEWELAKRQMEIERVKTESEHKQNVVKYWAKYYEEKKHLKLLSDQMLRDNNYVVRKICSVKLLDKKDDMASKYISFNTKKSMIKDRMKELSIKAKVGKFRRFYAWFQNALRDAGVKCNRITYIEKGLLNQLLYMTEDECTKIKFPKDSFIEVIRRVLLDLTLESSNIINLGLYHWSFSLNLNMFCARKDVEMLDFCIVDSAKYDDDWKMIEEYEKLLDNLSEGIDLRGKEWRLHRWGALNNYLLSTT
jgi:hypothetical protein